MSYWPTNQPPYPRYRLPNQPRYPGMFIAQPPPPAPAPPKPKRPWPLAAVNRWMGIGVVAITLLAVLLAVLAPLAANRPPDSTNLTVLYKSALRQNDGQWDENDTCHFTPDGYLVTAPNSRLAARCTLQTSNYQNFLLRIHIVAASQKASIGFLDGYWLEIQGTGRFQLAHVDGNLTTLLVPRGVVDIGAGSAALHPDSQGLSTRGNAITLLVQGTTITFYANGQMLGSYTASSVAGGPISLIAPQGQQALFSDLEIDQAP